MASPGEGLVIDKDIPPFEGEPDVVLDEEGMVRKFGLEPQRRKADKAGHYPTCRWVLVERKAKKIRDAVEQLRVTFEQVDRKAFPIIRLVIVYDRIGEARLFHVRRLERPSRRALFHRGRKGGPVTVGDIGIEAYTPEEVGKMYKQSHLNTGGSGSR